MKIWGVIPARFGSTRFPGKPLKPIAGKPLLKWVIEATLKSKKINEVLVATDNEAISDLAKNAGVRAIMTPSELPTGTDRVWSAVKEQAKAEDVVLNVQGDEPLITGEVLDALIEPFLSDSSLEMATLGRKLDLESLMSKNTAKIVVNERQEAMYFSRFPIPYSKSLEAPILPLGASLKHVGIYAYRVSFLEKFCSQAPVDVEINESLEQLRALYLGARIRVVLTEHESWGVDTPEDVAKIEAVVKRDLKR